MCNFRFFKYFNSLTLISSVFSLISRNKYVKHTILAIMTLIFLFFLWLVFLKIFTLHNIHIKVPNYIGESVFKIDSISMKNNLRYVILDSIYDINRKKGVVVSQDPLPDMNVKKNRRIYLTVNSLQSKKISFPDIYDLSLRQAINKLENIGIEIGDLDYVPDIALNKILDFKVNGIKVNVGEELYVGTIVDLVVGKGISNERIIIPNLVGLNRFEANIILKSTSLNIGYEFFKEEVSDSSTAIIYKQYPVSENDNEINIGSSIDLYFENSIKDN